MATTKKKMLLGAILMAAASMASVTLAGEYFVDCGRSDDLGPGTSWDTAFKTLQAAADAASDGDTIRVAAGTYSEGVTNIQVNGGMVRCRLYVDKKLHFIAASGKGSAHIVGAADDDDPQGQYGMGANAVRCVFVDYTSAQAPKGADTVFEGFVLRDGHTCCTNAVGTDYGVLPNMGGGLLSAAGANACLVDCVVSNCTAKYGGAMHGGMAIRTFLSDNGALQNGGAAMRECVAANCIFTRNRQLGQTATVSATKLYNCTLICDSTQWTLYGMASEAYNTLSVHSGTRIRYNDSVATVANCVMWPESANAASLTPAPHGPCQTMSSFSGDWRPVTTGDAVGAGDASHLAAIVVPDGSGIDVYRDFNGAKIVTTGAIQVGAVQTTATPAGGALFFNGASHLTQNGRPLGSNAWLYPESYPVQYAFKPADDGTTLQRVERRNPETGQVDYRNYPSIYPQMKDGTVYMMPSPDSSMTLTNESKVATQILWANPYADASVADGSKDRPFRTLQAAYAAAASGSKESVIVYAERGPYAEGVTTNSTYGKFRLVSNSAKNVLFKSVDGPDATSIVGAPDVAALSSPAAADFPGCGDDAVNIFLCTANDVALQGFTLRDGYSRATGASSEQSARGAFIGNGTSVWPQALDCVFTNVHSTGAVTYGGVIVRCRFVGNHGFSSISRNGLYSSCYYGSNYVQNTGASANGYFYNSSKAYNCTLIGTPKLGRVSGVGEYWNCIVDGGLNIYNSSGTVIYHRSIVYNCAYYTGNATDWVDCDPKFVDRSVDGVLRSDSSAFTLSDVPTTNNYGTTYFIYATSDVNGNPITFTDGIPAIGAFQTPVQIATVTVEDPGAKGGYAVESGTYGENVLYEGDEIVFSLATGTRPCAGVKVNGVEYRFADSGDHKIRLTFEAVRAAGGAVSVEGLYTTDWYVDDDGDDGNTGFTPFDAKKTLWSAADALSAGDTLWVLPGTYSEGSKLHNSARCIASRVVVKGDTSVVSTEGPERTFIVGGAATIGPDARGCGTNAVRCAALNGRGARLSGFTLTGGRTHITDKVDAEDYIGGAVIGYDYRGRDFSFGLVVENCIISNNVAGTGSAAARVQLMGCRVLDNVAPSWSSCALVYQGSAFASYIDGNEIGAQAAVFNYSENVCGCTIGPGNKRTDGTAAGGFGFAGFGPNTKGRIYNSLFCVPTGMSGTMEIRNSVFASGSTFNAECDTNETVVVAGSFELEPDGSAKIGSNPAVDSADLSLYDFVKRADMRYDNKTWTTDTDRKYVSNSVERISAWCRGAADLGGDARVANGVADVGCFEADWRGVYAAILGAKCEVTSASPNVVAAVGGSVVSMNGAGELACVLRPRGGAGARSDYEMHVRVLGGGMLTVTLNGSELAAVTASDGDRMLGFSSALAENAVTFTYEPGEGEDAGAEVFGFRRSGGIMIIVQ